MKKRKILVVDDDLDILEIIGLILESEGYEVELMSNGQEIFEHITQFSPDLIILDVMLGNMDGREICNNIKNTRDTLHIPIIMISATHNMAESLRKNCQPDDFLEKPFDIVSLINKVELKLTA
ncbi:MAG: response regulator [Daejeonella sp.]|uniref:response regulator n=1 Tax=Daejeonella sp. JGW-45 TaxID=3034148 RepID=UPI0023ED37BF|nr:response regulator [Daejeonella sp. JGW-45]